MRTSTPFLTASVLMASIGAASFCSSLAHAQTGAPVTTKADAPPISDPKFIEQATAAGKAEVEAGKIAAQKATNPDVKSFAQEMIRDHEKANAELAKLADKSGAPPTGSKGSPPLDAAGAAGKQSAQSLSGLSGAQFDREYMITQVKDHEEAVKLYETQAASSKDEQLRNFATAQLPVLKQHLERAHAIADPLVSSEASSGTAGSK
jgi:putative membrane protein